MTSPFSWIDLIVLQLIQMECSEHEAKGLMTCASVQANLLMKERAPRKLWGDRGVNCVETYSCKIEIRLQSFMWLFMSLQSPRSPQSNWIGSNVFWCFLAECVLKVYVDQYLNMLVSQTSTKPSFPWRCQCRSTCQRPTDSLQRWCSATACHGNNQTLWKVTLPVCFVK